VHDARVLLLNTFVCVVSAGAPRELELPPVAAKKQSADRPSHGRSKNKQVLRIVNARHHRRAGMPWGNKRVASDAHAGLQMP